jgi:hypothetical protein
MVELRLRDDTRDILRRLAVHIGSTLVVTATRTGEGQQCELVRAEVTALEHDFDALGAQAVIRGLRRVPPPLPGPAAPCPTTTSPTPTSCVLSRDARGSTSAASTRRRRPTSTSPR